MTRRPSSSPEGFTDAFLRDLAVPPGRKDIVAFEPRSGLGVRKTDMGAVSFLIQLRQRDGRRWRETLRPQWPHLNIADAHRALQVRIGELASGLDLIEAAAELEAKREASAAAPERPFVEPLFTKRVSGSISTLQSACTASMTRAGRCSMSASASRCGAGCAATGIRASFSGSSR
jgi:hypothetical protein